jgi:hypothetical protein
MNRRHSCLIGLAIAASLAVALGGCSGATATPTAFTGSQICTSTASGTEEKVGDVTQYREVGVRCVTEASDPRVTGVQGTVMSMDQRADKSADIWGTLKIANDEGSWDGDFSGTVEAGYTTHAIDGTAQGTGAYSGLRLKVHATSAGGTNFELTGTIEPAK